MPLVRCKECVMPTTRPALKFDSDGVCLACNNYERNKLVDWDDRFHQLEELCAKYRRTDGHYDCVIPVSGGKDSHYQVYILKEKLGMNPLLICVADPFTHTKAGTHNLRNLSESFNCDLITYQMSIDLFKRVTKIGFEELHEPLRFIESAIYTAPLKCAVAMNIPLIVYGENTAYLYGVTDDDGYDARRYVEAGHSASGDKISNEIVDYWVANGIELKELNCVIPPSQEDLNRVKPLPIFLSYFTGWDDERNYEVAKRCGFKDLRGEWDREGCVENYMQVDSLAYMVHVWNKFPKFGFQRVSDIASRWVRKGLITRGMAMRLVKEHDPKLDQRSLDDFCDFMGYTPKQFWDVVETYWNKDLFEKVDGVWMPKEK